MQYTESIQSWRKVQEDILLQSEPSSWDIQSYISFYTNTKNSSNRICFTGPWGLAKLMELYYTYPEALHINTIIKVFIIYHELGCWDFLYLQTSLWFLPWTEVKEVTYKGSNNCFSLLWCLSQLYLNPSYRYKYHLSNKFRW